MLTHTGLFAYIVVIFLAAFVGGTGARLLRLPSLIGYLSVGVVIGPHAFGLVSNVAEVQTLAELGVVLLLFAVGVQVSLKDFGSAGKRVVMAGAGQIVGSIAVGYGMGQGLGWGHQQSAVFGMVLSMSSTMVVLKTLTDQGQASALHGRVLTGILVMQDLASAPMLAVLPALSGQGSGILGGLGISALKAAGVLGIGILIGSKVIPWLLRRVALRGSRESFVVAVVAIALGAAAATEAIGISAALGAFGAGLVVSESDWTGYKALQEVIPLRDSFAALFFVSLGMLVDPRFLANNLALTCLVIAAAIVVKLFLTTGLLRATGYLPSTALLAGLGVAQLGEFGFILAGAAAAFDVVNPSFLPLIVVTAVVTMAATPGILAGAVPLTKYLERHSLLFRPYRMNGPEEDIVLGSTARLHDHVIVAGLGRVGSLVAQELSDQQISFIGVDSDPVAVGRVQRLQWPAVYGDAANETVLSMCAVERARLLALTVPDPVAALVVVQQARRYNPGLRVVARAGWRAEVEALHEAGAEVVVWPEREAGVEMVRSALLVLGVAGGRVDRTVAEVRSALEFGPAPEQSKEAELDGA